MRERERGNGSVEQMEGVSGVSGSVNKQWVKRKKAIRKNLFSRKFLFHE